MRRLAVSVFILLLVLCDLSAFAQRRPAPPNRPPPVGPRGGGPSGVRPTIPRITRPPRSMDPARRQPIPRSSSAKVAIPPAKSPEVARARVEAKTKLDQLRSLRARLRSSTALDSTLNAPKNRNWKFGSYKSATKWANQMASRGWTEQQITDAIEHGKQYPAPNLINPKNGATRYVNPTTGRYVVVDKVTREIIQLGGDGFIPK